MCLVFLAGCDPALIDRHRVNRPSPGEVRVARWSGTVEGFAVLSLQGERLATTLHSHAAPHPRVAESERRLPRADLPLRLRNVTGPGNVWVVGQPCAASDWTCTVLVDDLYPVPAGSYTFELWAEATAYQEAIRREGTAARVVFDSDQAKSALVWHGFVDGAVLLRFKGDRAWTDEFYTWSHTSRTEVPTPLAREGVQLRLTSASGRGRTVLLGQPCAANDYTATVLLDDVEPLMAAPYTLTLDVVPPTVAETPTAPPATLAHGTVHARPPVALPPAPPRDAGQRRAVVIGIGRHQYRGKWGLTNLRYAARDAEALAAYLRDPAGGRFDRVDVLTDTDATTRRITMAIREELRGVQPTDVVVIFWAGHGSPDPHEPGRLYLVTHDTDPEHMASTAYAMDAFRRDVAALRAGRVLVLADTCHAAGVSDPAVGLRGQPENRVVQGLRGIAVEPNPTDAASRMRLIFTSCETGERSRESADLGGGHGVFTWFLLQGLRGQADTHRASGNGDGTVTLGEVIEYTRDQVKRHTGNQQHPDTAGSFDRGLRMGGGP